MAVKVYGPVTAGCPQRVLVCLVEMGVDFEVVHVDLETGDHKKPEFLPLQPFGQVPVIEDGDFRLFESRAIVRYYASKNADHGPNLLGTTLEEKALVDQWLEVESHNFNDMIYGLVLQLEVLPRMGEPSDFKLVQKFADNLDKVLDVYEERLSKSKYLAGDYYTIADMCHLPGITFLLTDNGLGHLIRERKNVNSWWNDISSRPAWKRVLELMK
ncbi:glutathione S-transferase F12 [Coffea eugenioides]|uniref:glutathione transferase n=1 Tax=Coffea arabica TaxID=13443 RepID=A0A6P6TI93_COFAR|nr:glutathione S-transferase F12-like isoform X1 [Coffea arabica]XP_027179127.1 glutathione S-transferase F12 [Coffea eugenioides]